jgi:ribosomal protein S27E
MSHDPDAAYRCQKCGATAALLMPEPIAQARYVTVKCLECAHVQRVLRSLLEGAGGALDTTGSLD